MTLYETIDLLKKIALKHPNIGSASEGNIYEYMNANPSVKYGVFFITQGTHSQDEMFNHFEFTLFYVDRLVDDMEENRLQIQSIGKEILSNILTFFCEEFDAECENISFQPFTQKFLDLTAGIYSTITIDVPKDVICPEEYWKEDWATPVTVIRNQDKRVVFTENGTYTIDYDPTIYTGLGNVEVNVNIDVNSYYNQGKTDGINEQKSKLEAINITQNGTYTKEDGYNHIEVNVPDLNGSYDEGYNQGQADVAANARVLNVTKNGTYLSKFSDPIMPTTVTGVYADGTNFYSYAYLEGISYDSGFMVSEDMKVEIWWKGDVSNTDKNLFGSQVNNNDAIFKIRIPFAAYRFDGEIAMGAVTYLNAESDRWYHFKMSYADGFWVDDVKIGDFSRNISGTPDKLYINSNTPYSFNGANGYFGMIKITTNGVENIIIPTAEGLKNITTNEILQVAQNGSYTFTENMPIYPEGELYKTVNVNVLPKINLEKEGLKFGSSTFTEVPEWADFEGITDMINMFDNCDNLQTIPMIDTSNVGNANNMFQYCRSLKTLPNNFNFGICSNLSNMFYSTSLTDYSFLETWVINPNAVMNEMINNTNTTYVPAIPCVGNTNYQQSAIFWAYSDYSKLTYFGGWIGRKYNVNKDRILNKMPNLTYESCISILNNLYDFTGNGEVPNNEQGQLKVHQNFLDKVGDEISIGTLKGWTITA